MLLQGKCPREREAPQRLSLHEQGARTPALRAAAAQTPLVVRERQITTLAADGPTNGDIAEQLFLSVRTVETTSTASTQESPSHIATT